MCRVNQVTDYLIEMHMETLMIKNDYDAKILGSL